MPDGLRVRLRPLAGVTPQSALVGDFFFAAVIGDFEFEESAAHVDYDTVGAGSFSSPSPGGTGARELRSVTVSVIASNGAEPWLVDQGTSIADTHDTLSRLLHAKRPVMFTAWLEGDSPELRMRATIRRVSRVLRHAQLGVRYFDVDFTEWRDNSIGDRQADPPGLPTKHRLAAADTGRSLSKHYYGHYTGALTILYANGLRRWGPETAIAQSSKFDVGDRVTIPKPPKASINTPGVR